MVSLLLQSRAKQGDFDASLRDARSVPASSSRRQSHHIILDLVRLAPTRWIKAEDSVPDSIYYYYYYY